MCHLTAFQLFCMNREGGGVLTRSGTHDFAPFGAFMILPVGYIYISEFVSLRTISTD